MVVVVQLLKVPWRILVLQLECQNVMLVAGENNEVAGFEHVTKLLHGIIDRQNFPVVGTVVLLCLPALSGGEVLQKVSQLYIGAFVTSGSGADDTWCADTAARC
jgi:hypothetical protein